MIITVASHLLCESMNIWFFIKNIAKSALLFFLLTVSFHSASWFTFMIEVSGINVLI